MNMLRKGAIGILICLLMAAQLCFAQVESYDSTFGSTYYYQKLTTHELAPVKKGAIIFLGNSITDIGHWEEFFPKARVLNRGISGDNTFGILHRIGEIVRHQPSKLFIMIGINDLARPIPVEVIVRNYGRIVAKVRAESPKTKIYIQSVLPTNEGFVEFKRHQGKMDLVRKLNIQLKELASQTASTYVDLHSIMLDEEGRLSKTYTNDGLHINGFGYKKWVETLEKLGHCCK
jgi:lysophospholipase L1-like esterase